MTSKGASPEAAHCKWAASPAVTCTVLLFMGNRAGAVDFNSLIVFGKHLVFMYQ